MNPNDLIQTKTNPLNFQSEEYLLWPTKNDGRVGFEYRRLDNAILTSEDNMKAKLLIDFILINPEGRC